MSGFCAHAAVRKTGRRVCASGAGKCAWGDTYNVRRG